MEMCELFHSLPGSRTLQENKSPHLVGHTKKKKCVYIYIYIYIIYIYTYNIYIYIPPGKEIAGDRHSHQFWYIMAPKTKLPPNLGVSPLILFTNVDGSEILLTSYRLVVYPIIYKALYIPGG